MIAVPAYTGTVHVATMRAILGDVLALVKRGDAFTLIDECGSALIADARAEIVARFLSLEGATHLVFVDHDVAWQAGALLRLVDHPVDVVAGVYPHRKDPLSFPVAWLEKDELWADPATGLLEVAGVPGGFLSIQRHVLETMCERYASLAYQSERAVGGRAIGLFEPYRRDGLKFSEDFSFCQRWRDIGGKVWIDPSITMLHVGNKTFAGNIGNWLRERD